ncbi:MAG: PTS sugar transporter subunit IIA [Planctomycetota bacterium]
MNLTDILCIDHIKAPLDHTDKKAVIEELVELFRSDFEEAGRAGDINTLKQAVWQREQTRTTGIGEGLAIPHGRSDVLNRLLLAIGRPAEPIDFDSIDRRPVRLVILLVSPPDRTSEHIQALGKISRLMQMRSFREAVYEANSAAEIYDLLAQHESAEART